MSVKVPYEVILYNTLKEVEDFPKIDHIETDSEGHVLFFPSDGKPIDPFEFAKSRGMDIRNPVNLFLSMRNLAKYSERILVPTEMEVVEFSQQYANMPDRKLVEIVGEIAEAINSKSNIQYNIRFLGNPKEYRDELLEDIGNLLHGKGIIGDVNEFKESFYRQREMDNINRMALDENHPRYDGDRLHESYNRASL